MHGSIYDDTDEMRELRAKLRADHEAELERMRELAADDELAEDETDASEADTREKLEADVRSSIGFTTKDVIVWLDRQAAITTREWRERCASEECCGFQELVDAYESLQAEHDDLKRANERQACKIREVCELNESLNRNLDKAEREFRESHSRCDKLRADLNTATMDNDYLRGQLAERDQLEKDSAYMRLPVDADGEPIHIGDTLAYGDHSQGIVKAVGERMVVAMHVDDDNLNFAKYGLLWEAEGCRHVRERTVEDILQELVEVAQDPRGGELDDGDIEGYAAEIRKLVKEQS